MSPPGASAHPCCTSDAHRTVAGEVPGDGAGEPLSASAPVLPVALPGESGLLSERPSRDA